MKNTYEEERIKVGTVVDNDGVILNNIYEGDKIVTPKQDEYKNKYAINFKKGDAFVKMFISPLCELYKELSSSECAVVLGTMSFISYKDGILRYDNKILNVKEICELLDANYETFKRTFANLIKKEVFKKIERQSDKYADKTKKCIVVNPYIFLRGQDIEKSIVEEFSNTKWANI